MVDQTCIFCRIVEGKIPCYKIYEDKDFLAFLDIAPFVEGHTLVISKKHFRWVWDVPEIGEYFLVVKRIVAHFQKVFQDDFVACLIWGVDVPHAHVQIFPRPHSLYLSWQRGKLTPEKAKKLVKKLSFK